MGADNPAAFEWDGVDLILRVTIQTQASSDQLVGLQGGRLRLRISAAPIEGKANKHLSKFLGKLFGVPKSRIIIEKGETSRNKRIRVQAPVKWPALLAPSGSE